ncbi:MAG: glycoside hydrolase family 9 protein [Lentisphaeria bacterium]|nr:glycoside hydrolase family 9 protein [Lentisphaeria bacterium]
MVFLILVLSFLVLVPATAFPGEKEMPLRGRWKCTALGPDRLALTGDYTHLQEMLFKKCYTRREEKAARWGVSAWAQDYRFHISGTEAIAMYRPKVTAMLLDHPKIQIATNSSEPLSITGTGYWMSPIGQSRFKDSKGVLRLSRNADTAHYLFLTLNRKLKEGEKIHITLPAGEKVEYSWSIHNPSPLFKFNQLGYMPKAHKYAYVGAWLGTAGKLPLHKELDGKAFQLVEAKSGKTVFTGKLQARMEDPVNSDGTPFTGEEVLELDFSSFETPGSYKLVIPEAASSDVFRIGDDTMAEAFYIHARGLYHQRCGIAKTADCTHWVQKECHQICLQGNFPPDDGDYGKGSDKSPSGFFDSYGKRMKVNHFELIQKCKPIVQKKYLAPGGWHDAADWDRRPQHLRITGDLAMVYLLKPENFCDGQLNLPEKANSIPDILDEAVWGLEHLRKTQQPDGGVGTWIETTRHPRPGEGMASDDKLVYYVSFATKNSTLEYASYASLLALALRKAGAESLSAQYRDSAVKAWRYAVRYDKAPPKVFFRGGKTFYYRENPVPAPEFLVKAGFNLFQLTGDELYLHKAEDAAKDAAKSMKRNAWRWSAFQWMELEIFPSESAVLQKLLADWRKSIVSSANMLLRQQEENYPIRIAWPGPRDGWVHAMSWGTFHPLVRARTMIAAHALTRDDAYLEGALLANDFHNGANPFGSTMTSGLGRVYPVRFLDLNSYADGIAEQIPGITPYRNTYGIPRNAVKMAYGLYYPKRPDQGFAGLSLSLLPGPGLDENACAKALGKLLPIWRRWCNVESETVDASEFTVWETIAPCAVVTGYLLNGARRPDPRWIDRKPAKDVRELPGYAPLP